MNTSTKSLVRKSIALANKNIMSADIKRVEKIGRARESALAIFRVFCTHPQSSITDIVTATGYPRPTVTNSIRKLVDIGILRPMNNDKKWGQIYSYDAIIGQVADLSNGNTCAQNKDGCYLHFSGRDFAIRQANTPPKAKFNPTIKKHTKVAHRLYIGDNLDIMKAIMPEYAQQFDLIYVDTPYNQPNTYNNRAYADKFDGHCEFLSMLYPRLMLCRRLLSDTGLVAISINDYEFAQLKIIMDEIFGPENYINTIVIESGTAAGIYTGYTKYRLPNIKSYLLVYARDKKNINFLNRLYDPIDKKFATEYSTIIRPDMTKQPLINFIADDKWICAQFNANNLKPSLQNIDRLMHISREFEVFMHEKVIPYLYKTTLPKAVPTESVQKHPTNTIFCTGDKLLEKTTDNKVHQYKPFANRIQAPDFSGEYQNSLIRGDIWKGFDTEKSRIQSEGGVNFSSGKKPVRLIRDLLVWINNKDARVLDIFAGSGTTYQAVIEMNKRDNGHRTVVLCQIPEPVNPASKEYKQGFRTIDKITRQRIINVSDIDSETLGGVQIYR